LKHGDKGSEESPEKGLEVDMGSLTGFRWPSILGFALLTGALILAGCNYPGLRTGSGGEPSVQEIRQTLAAITYLTPPAESTQAAAAIDLTPFPGLNTATPGRPGVTPGPYVSIAHADFYQYYAQPGDSLTALAGRFDIEPELIVSTAALPPAGLIQPGTELWIPNRVRSPPFPSAALPDSEVIDSPAMVGFDPTAFIGQSGGYLSRHVEMVAGEQLSGAEIVQRVALESSVSPRFLLALIELRAGWVRGLPGSRNGETYPIGFRVGGSEGLYKELVVTATHLNAGYYGWRAGSLTRLEFRDGGMARGDPLLNAGTIAVQHLLAKLYSQDQVQAALYGPGGLLDVYQQLFGDPWERAAGVEPLFPAGVSQPALALPFVSGERWSLTGGPHPAWKTGSPRGAVDLAPVTGEASCAVSYAWITAPAPGLVVRSARNVVALDLDGDGYEQTGWVLIFMHVANHERVIEGTRLNADERIGHPSCEGGRSTGTHVHIARKFNGEWIPADWPLPFILSGWQVYAGTKDYQGGMVNGEQEVVASPVGPRTSIIMR
jgi:murein DD-endopeptidase MepM/ murein hydrolase activator NlpD